MIETAVRTNGDSVEHHVRAQLARSDASAATIQPILRHLLGRGRSSMLSDEVVARIRGMHGYLVQQLLPLSLAGDVRTIAEDRLTHALNESPQILAHLHAAAMEWQLAEQLDHNYAVDPVVSPLLQALIASPSPQSQELAMKLLAAQARWCQGQRRMQLSAQELPGELFHEVLLAVRSVVGDAAQTGEDRLRAGYDEGATRLGLAARLVTSMGSAGSVALDLRHGGSMLFVTALSLGSGQAREQAIFSTDEGQGLRLALGLRAAGLAAGMVEQHLLLLHGEAYLPSGFDRLNAERAAALLAEMSDARR
jgi:hypothetical protein